MKLKGVILIAAVHFKVDLCWCLKLGETLSPRPTILLPQNLSRLKIFQAKLFSLSDSASSPQNLGTHQIKTNSHSSKDTIHTYIDCGINQTGGEHTTREAFKLSTFPNIEIRDAKKTGKSISKARKIPPKNRDILVYSTLLLLFHVKSKLVWLVSFVWKQLILQVI